MDIKLFEKIGSGLFGSIYKARIKNLNSSNEETCIYKIQKLDDIEEGLKSEYNRIIDFNNKVVKKYTDKFMLLKSYGIVENCEYKQDIPEFLEPKGKKFLEDRNSSSYCCYYIYTPILDGTLSDIKEEIMTNNNLYYDMLHQIVTGLSIIKKHGFCHNDIHSQNIMYKKIDNKYIWYIIDYGAITHKNYPDSKFDKIRGARTLDIISFIWKCCVFDTASNYANKNKIKYNTNKSLIDKIKKSEYYTDIKKYIPNELFDNVDKNENNIKFLIIILFMILNYNMYKEYLGLTGIEWEKFNLIIPNKDLLLFMIKKCNNESHSTILKKINSFINK